MTDDPSLPACPHSSQLEIVGQMHEIGANAGLEPADLTVDTQQSRRK